MTGPRFRLAGRMARALTQLRPVPQDLGEVYELVCEFVCSGGNCRDTDGGSKGRTHDAAPSPDGALRSPGRSEPGSATTLTVLTGTGRQQGMAGRPRVSQAAAASAPRPSAAAALASVTRARGRKGEKS